MRYLSPNNFEAPKGKERSLFCFFLINGVTLSKKRKLVLLRLMQKQMFHLMQLMRLKFPHNKARFWISDVFVRNKTRNKTGFFGISKEFIAEKTSIFPII
ncbi:hypothetical protein CH366_18535 [Leptospira harrisiae]|nr:hypothetical protein CH366_18535 [Leptospira harrisiae]